MLIIAIWKGNYGEYTYDQGAGPAGFMVSGGT